MTGFVADSSVAVGWAVDSQADEATRQLRQKVIDGAQVVVPGLWSIEVANSLLVLFRRRRLTRTEWDGVRGDLAEIPITIDDQGPVIGLSRISKLADEFSLTAYDATYLELANRRGLPLASRYGALNKAARKLGVETLL